MYGSSDLKAKIRLTDTTVECPVRDCNATVERQRRVFRRLDNFKCPQHGIYISPTTFEYETEFDNLLWTDTADSELFKKIKAVKRESRISRDNSEDAVSWNVFRYLERNNLLDGLLTSISGSEQLSANLILWSYCNQEQNNWTPLNKARIEFGETVSRGSEPDIIITTNSTLFFIEAKVLATNETTPSDPNNPKKYISGGDGWYSKVFSSNYNTVAVSDKRYELLRFWLLGSWLANELKLKFHLVNLVLADRELTIEKDFGRHIIQNDNNRFSRFTWESIYEFIANPNRTNSETQRVLNYFKNKTAGYDINGVLQKVFSI